MKQSLHLKLGQQLTMTPQLQQAIRMLQLSTVDLQQEIQEALYSNPMLESDDGQGEEGDGGLIDLSVPEPSERSMNSAWDEHYGSLPAGSDDYEPQSSSVESLQDHLEWQLDLMAVGDRQRLIGLAIIEAVNPDGYLTCSLDELFSTLQTQLDGLTMVEITALQQCIQQFDPVGCASADLRQCLLAQLRQLSPTIQHYNNAEKLIGSHLELLGSHDYARILRRTKWHEGQLRDALTLIRQLNPRPGSAIGQGESQYVVPDLSVRKVNGCWTVELNSEALPKLRINNNYASLVQRANNSRDNVFMKDHLLQARWFLKNLQSRNETLMKVTGEIIVRQQGFLEQGDEAMKPLVLADIAEAVGMHESTISRVTTQKYLHTPRGVYELKYFFSSHVATAEGGECSSTAIRAQIRKLIAAEPQRKPLSDNKIAALLSGQGIQVARRTIAKYREAMKIPPSNERKELANVTRKAHNCVL